MSLKKLNKVLEKRVKERLGPYDKEIELLKKQVVDLKKTRNNLEERLKDFM